MSENNTAPVRKHRKAPRRRQNPGVPVALVVTLLVITLFFGGLLGFILANKTNANVQKLEEAYEKIDQLENTLVMMGFSADTTDAEQWVFDDSGAEDEFADLSGSFGSDSSEILWDDGSLLNGMLDYTGESVVVAEFTGGTLMSDEVIDPYNDRLASQVFDFGNAAEVSGSTLSAVLEELVAEKICLLKAESLGLTTLTDADLAKIEADAAADLEEQKAFYAAYISEDQDAGEYLASELGITLEGLIEERKAGYWQEKLFAHVTQDVTVSDAEIQAEYDALVAAQRDQFTSFPEDYEFALMIGQPIAYNPEGYRYVKHILLPFADEATEEQVTDLTEAIALLNPEDSMDRIAELQAQLDPLYADLEAQADSILAQLNAGASFDDLLAQYGADPAMTPDSPGYLVSSSSTDRFAPDFLEGCMMLSEPGQLSTPVRTIAGVHIILYASDLTPGEVPLDAIRDPLANSLLLQNQDAHYINQLAQWLTEAAPKYYPERLQ